MPDNPDATLALAVALTALQRSYANDEMALNAALRTFLTNHAEASPTARDMVRGKMSDALISDRFAYNLVRADYDVSRVAIPDAGRHILHSSETGAVGLWGYDQSSRQRWIFQRLEDGRFNIKVQGGTNSGETYLSYGADGSIVDLYDHDDGSGRQRWIVEEYGDTCRIQGAAPVGGCTLELRVTGDEVHLAQDTYWWQLRQAGPAQAPAAVHDNPDHGTAFLGLDPLSLLNQSRLGGPEGGMLGEMTRNHP